MNKLIYPIILIFGSIYCRAHDTWLQPRQTMVEVNGTAEFAMTSAAGFVGPETAIKPGRVSRAFGIIAGQRFLLSDFFLAEKTLGVRARFVNSGVATVCIDLKPRVLTLAPDKIEEYLREIHAGAEVRAAWAAVPSPRKWRESYIKHTKAFVAVGNDARTDRSWDNPLGAALEIVPEQNPTTLQAGDKLSVVVMRSGVPFPNFNLGFVAAGEKAEHIVTTDKSGRAQAPLDVKGFWLVHGTDLRRSQEPDLEWESDFVTMVVEAR